MIDAIEDILYFLVVINPASKISFLAACDPPLDNRELRRVSMRASLVALAIFIAAVLTGHFALKYIFRVEIGTLRIAGGLVLFVIGLQMIREGLVTRTRAAEELAKTSEDISVVPLAAPLIAGPGTITVMISYAALRGGAMVCIDILIAVLINMLLMFQANTIGRFFVRYGIMGAVVKLTGLIVTAIAMQMVLQGVGEWLKIWHNSLQ